MKQVLSYVCSWLGSVKILCDKGCIFCTKTNHKQILGGGVILCDSVLSVKLGEFLLPEHENEAKVWAKHNIY
jgi:hypothetical protein